MNDVLDFLKEVAAVCLNILGFVLIIRLAVWLYAWASHILQLTAP